MRGYVFQFLDYYLSLDEPGYAILIDGNWGSGKTYFIKKFTESRIESYKKTNEFKKQDNPFIYISLNGLNNPKEIDDKIFFALHPILSSKPLALLGRIASAAMKIGAKIDFSDGKYFSLSSSSTSVSLKELFKKVKNKILILDDLERCNIEHSELLGFINQFVEHEKLKVICLANEKELDRSKKTELEDNGETKRLSTYRLIKEKVFGKILRINPRIEEVFEILVNDVETARQDFPKNFILSNKENLIRIFNESETDNLRIFKLILLDWHFFWNLLDVEAKGKKKMLDELLMYFFAFSFEIRSGNMKYEEFQNLIENLSKYYVSRMSGKSSEIESNVKKFLKYSLLFRFQETFLAMEIWSKWFKNGTIETRYLNEYLRTTKFFYDETTPSIHRIFEFYDLAEDEFLKHLKKVLDEWNASEFEDPKIIIQYFSAFLILLKMDLELPFTKETLIEDVVKKIKFWIKRHESKIDHNYSEKLIFKKQNTIFDNSDELNQIYERTKDDFQAAKEKSLEGVIDELYSVLKFKFEEFIFLTAPYSHDSKYASLPIYSYMNVNKLADSILESEPNAIFKLSQSFKERYSLDNLVYLHKDLEVLKNCKFRIETILENQGNGIKKKMVKTFFVPALADAIKNLESYQNQI